MTAAHTDPATATALKHQYPTSTNRTRAAAWRTGASDSRMPPKIAKPPDSPRMPEMPKRACKAASLWVWQSRTRRSREVPPRTGSFNRHRRRTAGSELRLGRRCRPAIAASDADCAAGASTTDVAASGTNTGRVRPREPANTMPPTTRQLLSPHDAGSQHGGAVVLPLQTTPSAAPIVNVSQRAAARSHPVRS